MGIGFKFVPKEVKKVSLGTAIIHKSVDGVIILIDGEYYFHYKNFNYPLHSSCYSSKNRKIIYSRNKDEHNNYIKIIRDKSKLVETNENIYIPFRDKLNAKGNIIKSNNKTYFKAITFYNSLYKEEIIESNKLINEENE